MAKLIIVLATVFAALLLVDASIYRATVVIEEDVAKPRPGRQDCRQQFEQQQRLRNCQEFIRYRSRQSERGMNPQREEQQELQSCCDQLRNLEGQCRCEALEYAARELQQGAGQESQRLQEVFRVAQQIPSLCQVSPGQCQFGQRSAY